MLKLTGDKSISHRALLLAAIASGETDIIGLSDSLDVQTTKEVLTQLGVTIRTVNENHVRVQGVGLRGFAAPKKPLYCGNSGTTLRLLSGMLVAQAFSSTLTGDDSLVKRPMRRIVEPLTKMKASICGGTPPLFIAEVGQLQGIRYALPVPSAQVKSAILLAGLYAQDETIIEEPLPTRDHTERLLAYWGCPWRRSGTAISIRPIAVLKSMEVSIPRDVSSAMFFIVAVSCLKNRRLTLKDVGVNPTRLGGIQILREMGANISIRNERLICNEPVGDIVVESAELTGVTISGMELISAIDELPILMIAAACAQGTTVLRGAQELRVKECDRLKALAEGLKALGIAVQEFPDGMSVTGGVFQGGEINTYSDHRIAMSFAVANLLTKYEIILDDKTCVNISFPGFWEALGACLE